MTDRKKTIIFIVLSMIILLTIITYLFDVPIVKFVESIRSDSLDYLFLSITFASNVFIIFFFLTTLFLWKEHKRRWILPLWFASFFSVLTSYVLKVFVHRHRPFQAGWVSVLSIAFNFMRDNFNTWNFSFPSFQAMLVFSAVPLLNKEFKNQIDNQNLLTILLEELEYRKAPKMKELKKIVSRRLCQMDNSK